MSSRCCAISWKGLPRSKSTSWMPARPGTRNPKPCSSGSSSGRPRTSTSSSNSSRRAFPEPHPAKRQLNRGLARTFLAMDRAARLEGKGKRMDARSTERLADIRQRLQRRREQLSDELATSRQDLVAATTSEADEGTLSTHQADEASDLLT